VVVISYQRSQ